MRTSITPGGRIFFNPLTIVAVSTSGVLTESGYGTTQGIRTRMRAPISLANSVARLIANTVSGILVKTTLTAMPPASQSGSPHAEIGRFRSSAIVAGTARLRDNTLARTQRTGNLVTNALSRNKDSVSAQGAKVRLIRAQSEFFKSARAPTGSRTRFLFEWLPELSFPRALRQRASPPRVPTRFRPPSVSQQRPDNIFQKCADAPLR